MRSDITIVIPSYNEQGTLPDLLQDILKQYKSLTLNGLIEIIIVDDCSDVPVSTYLEEYSCLRVIRLSTRSGSHFAIKTGIKAARSTNVMFLAGDGQDPPCLIGQVLEKTSESWDLLWCSREVSTYSPLTDIGARIFYFLISLLNPCSPFSFNLRPGVFALRGEALSKFRLLSANDLSIFLLAESVSSQTSAIHYSFEPRKKGKSKWSSYQKSKLAVKWLWYLFHLKVLGYRPSALSVSPGPNINPMTKCKD